MGNLSRNLSTGEFACQCGCGFTRPAFALVDALQAWQCALSEIKGFEVVIHINSGCRCKIHNAEVKGSSPKSQHLYGRGADGWADHCTMDEMFAAAKAVPAFNSGGIIVYYNRLHLDVRGKRYHRDKRRDVS